MLTYNLRAIAQSNSEPIYWTSEFTDDSEAPEPIVNGTIIISSTNIYCTDSIGFQSIYEVDFSTLSHSNLSDGDISINDKTWTVSNVTNCTYLRIDNNGLEFSANSTNTSFTNSTTRNAPRLSIKLIDLIPSLTDNSWIRCTFTQPTNNAIRNFELSGVQIDDNSANNFIAVTRGYHVTYGGNTVYQAYDSSSGALSQNGTNTNYANNTCISFDIVNLKDILIGYIKAGLAGSNYSIPDITTLTNLYRAIMPYERITSGYDNLYLHIFFATYNTIGSFQASIKNFRVDIIQ